MIDYYARMWNTPPGIGCIWLFETVIFQRMHEKPTKFKKVFAIGKRKCTGRIVSTHLTGRFCASCSWFLVGPLMQCAGAFVFLLLVHSLINIFQIFLTDIVRLDIKCQMRCDKVCPTQRNCQIRMSKKCQ